ncbi:small nuclear ribonucleoprotein U2, A [Myriangium duriaei CBS 260.36]|uniref:U2 small nuclear ribonucleoprotein A' n=1 Tax=Myriangium duriaei CBS 260.36 TaxID=1168546 RepID=A0A9P4ISS0_9PEZI|nr:small nuclear ribonucleoprotein U2, A [Myriangium duriaei CBS 260.36]
MRLTAELITNSLSYINPLKERELDLRGNKIPTLENLAPALHNDALDLTDNALTSLSNFPLFPRITSLYCARNRISHISPSLGKSLPKLSTLVLTENSLSDLSDLAPLRSCAKLVYLTVLENPVAAKEHYRLWIIFLLPSVRHLDFIRVRDAERTASRELFGTLVAPTDTARKILQQTTGRPLPVADGDGGEPPAKRMKVRMTDEERKRVEQMVRDATSLKEIERLERMIAEGRVPG